MAIKKVKSAVKKKKPAKKEPKEQRKAKELIQEPKEQKEPKEQEEPKELSEKHKRKFARMGRDINSGTIRTFEELFDILDKTPIANAIGRQQLEAKLKDPRKFTMGDVLELARVTEASEEKTVLLFLYHAMGLDKNSVEQRHKNNTTGKP